MSAGRVGTTLSVCLLTRDEERNIERALRSVAGAADEVIVADTGSTDRTREIAEGLGARVEAVPWDDDFAEGRNQALALARGDWIFWLNPDEELLADGPGKVRALVAAPPADAFGSMVHLRHQMRSDRPDETAETIDLRLFRRRPDVRYLGRTNPVFAPELAGVLARDGLRLYDSEIALRHHAYASVLDESKLRWAARLLERELSDRPGRLPYLAEYARTLLLLGDPRGHEVMAEAVAMILPVLDAPRPPGPDAQVVLEYLLSGPPGSASGLPTPDEVRALALRWFPTSPPLLWSLAARDFRAGEFGRAAGLLERLVHLGATGSHDPSRAFDPTIIGAAAVWNLGECYTALRRPDRARVCYGRLLDHPDYASRAAARLAASP